MSVSEQHAEGERGHQPKEALGIVRRHLAPDGAVYLFWDARHMQPGRARDLPDQLSERIRLAEFSVNQVLVKACALFPRFA